MKKLFFTLITAAMLCGLCSCADNNEPADSTQPTSDVTTATSAKTTAPTSSASTAVTTAEPVGTDTDEPDHTPAGADLTAFSYDANRAVVFSAPIEEQSDATLIAAAQALYRSAHDMSFSISSAGYTFRYEFDDTTRLPESELKAEMKTTPFFLITNEGVNSMADIAADYYKLFSDKYPYPEILNNLFVEYGGRLYGYGNGAGRGSNISYKSSEIISYDGRDGDELCFTVRDHYDDTLFGGDKYDKDCEFTAVIGSDGVLRAGKFTLPD